MRYHILSFCLALMICSCGFNAGKTNYSDYIKISSVAEERYIASKDNIKEFLDSKNIIKQLLLN